MRYFFSGLILFLIVTQPAFGKDACVTCHSNPDFLVTEPQLYRYFQEWSLSPHQQMGVACHSCHKGQPNQSSKQASHQGLQSLRGLEASQQVLQTCGECHSPIAQSYRKSPHFQAASQAKQGHLTPNCVTCHGSMNTAALSTATIQASCERCHSNQDPKRAAISQQVESLMNRFTAIHRFYRYASLRGKGDNREFLAKVDEGIHGLSHRWHSLDLEKIDQETQGLLQQLQGRLSESTNP